VGILLSALTTLSMAAGAFDFEDVAKRARELAAAPYKKPAALPKELQGLEYDRYRDIRYKPERQLWRDAKLPFELALLHQGYLYDQPVRIHEVTADGAREVRFDPDDFDYGTSRLDAARLREVNLGFAGFRVHYPLNTPKYKDEVLVFLGASYLRAIGRGQRYGASARGLAIDTALPSGEEFPHFTEFWIERPAPGAKSLTVYALLDSRRASGAYRFVLRPGTDTAMDVTARLYVREKVGKLGVAPLTSMYLFGGNQRPAYEDYRPEVHDSDGLSLHGADGEWIWRPLGNPRRLLTTSFAAANPRGFGLMQRDREYPHYEDPESRYELRPSVWIAPHGDWGAGRVELVQIPVPDETNDNVVAYWVPDAPPAPGAPYDFAYRMLWQKDAEAHPPQAWVAQTRRGRAYVRKPDDSVSFVIDWEGPALEKLAGEASADAKVEAVVSADGNGRILEVNAWPNEVTGGWRSTLRVRRLDDGKPVEMRAFLRSGGNAISETWSYILLPQ